MNRACKTLLIILFHSLLVPPIASAQPYIGLDLGTATINSAYEDATSAYIYAGYDFNNNISIEAGVTPLGYYKHKITAATMQFDGFEIDVLKKFEMKGNFTPYIMAGYYSYTFKPALAGVPLGEINGNSMTYGLGLTMDLAQTLKTRIAYEVYDSIETEKVERVVIGLAAKIF